MRMSFNAVSRIAGPFPALVAMSCWETITVGDHDVLSPFPKNDPNRCDERDFTLDGRSGAKIIHTKKTLPIVGRRGSHCPPVLVLGKDSEDSIGDRAIATDFNWLSHSEGTARSIVAHDRSLRSSPSLYFVDSLHGKQAEGGLNNATKKQLGAKEAILSNLAMIIDLPRLWT